jgi:hypothetical protein
VVKAVSGQRGVATLTADFMAVTSKAVILLRPDYEQRSFDHCVDQQWISLQVCAARE